MQTQNNKCDLDFGTSRSKVDLEKPRSKRAYLISYNCSVYKYLHRGAKCSCRYRNVLKLRAGSALYLKKSLLKSVVLCSS